MQPDHSEESLGCLDANTATEYLAGLLSAATVDGVDAHLDGCAHCRKHLSELVRSSTKTAGAPAVDAAGSHALPRGSRIGRYVLEEQVGVGAMGAVYAAHDPELRRRVALKMVRGDFTLDEASQNRLLHEAQAMARLSHPNVVAVHDVVLHDCQVFIAMELIAGESLKSWLRERRPWRIVLEAFVQAARGLAAAHDVGLVHRDFKPANVLRNARGRVAVTDFGLARAAETSGLGNESRPHLECEPFATHVTEAGLLVGTPAYMSPEQLRGNTADAKSDQFSFCTALYEGLYGEHPFLEPRESAGPAAARKPDALRRAIESSAVRAPPAAARVPSWLRKILLRGLAAEPENRHPSMGALVVALAEVPGARSRRWALGATIAASLLALGLGIRYARAPSPLLCKGADRKLAGAWDDAKKQRIGAAFRATGKPYAEDAWRRTEKALDGYAHEWVTTHTDACESTRLRGEQSAELLDRRMACLDDRLKEIRALTDVFAEADATAVTNAVAASESLARVSRCSDVRALLSRIAPPKDPNQAAKVQELRDEVARLRALRDSGKYRDCLSQAENVAKAAAALGYRPLSAEAHLLLGRARNDNGKLAEAEDALHDAVMAADAAGEDLLRAQSWTVLLDIAWQRADYSVAARRREEAMAALERLGGDEEALVSVLNAWSAALLAQEKWSLARSVSQEALAHGEKVDGSGSRRLDRALGNIALSYVGEGSYDEGLAYLRRSLAMTESLLGPHHPRLSADYGNVAGVLALTLDFAGAETYYQRSIDILQAESPENPRLATPLDNLGELNSERGNYEAAIPLHQRALTLREKMGKDHPRLVSSLAGLGRAYVGLNKPNLAIAPLERALKLATKTQAQDRALAQFFMAQALWATGGNRRTALTLARDARANAKTGIGPLYDRRRATIEAWLAQHPASDT